jgi:hypothetical protein
MPAPATRSITLEDGSIASVSAVDPSTGSGILIPFGLSPDGFAWVDPRGVDVTAGGLPTRSVSFAADQVAMSGGATVDLRGGGDLTAFRWVSGTGGSADILGTATTQWSSTTDYKAGSLVSHGGVTWSARTDISPTDYAVAPQPSKSLQWVRVPESFAVLPGFDGGFAPLNDFNTGDNKGALAGDPGYTADGLRLGDQVFLAGMPGLAAGSYTLLPRRYALLPGAFLVRPEDGGGFISSGSVLDTSVLNSGSLPFMAANLLPDGVYRAQSFTSSGLKAASASALREYVSVLTPAQVAARAQYNVYQASAFLESAANRLGLPAVQPLPKDSAQAAFHGNTGLVLEGSVFARSIEPRGKRGSIDVSSFGDIRLVGGDGAADASTSLRTDVLEGWGAGSLLIGGLRRTTADGVAIDVRSPSVVLDNPGGEFVAPEIVLTATGQVLLAAGSSLSADGGGAASYADPLLLTGEGAMLRVSADPDAIASRSGVGGTSDGAILAIGAGSSLSGASVTMDSSSALSLDFTSTLEARSLTMSSGQISVLAGSYDGDLDGSVVENHLVLDEEILSQLGSVEILRLSSYRTIDIYGSGSLGGGDFGRLELSAGGLRGFGSGSDEISIAAKSVLLANAGGAEGLSAYADGLSRLSVRAASIALGKGAFSLSGFGDVLLDSSGGLLAEDDGSLRVAGSLGIVAPVITSRQGISYDIAAEGNLDLSASDGEELFSPGLGGRLSLSGSSVSVDTSIDLPAGVLSITATEGDVAVSGYLSVAGQAQEFFDVTRYANAGNIELKSLNGAVLLQEGSFVSVSADEGGGDAGTLTIGSPGGVFDLGGVLAGEAAAGNLSGSLLLDAGALESFDELSSLVDAGGFREERSFRVRDGNVLIGATTKVRDFSLSADGGDITVRGRIDASGQTGGSIRLVTAGNLSLEPSAVLDVSGRVFSNAGKGGSVVLEAGSAIDGVADGTARLSLAPGSLVDLSVDAFRPGSHDAPGSSAFYGQVEGTLHLRAARTGNDVGGIGPIASTINRGSSVLVEGFRVYQPDNGIMNIALRETIHADNAQFMIAGEEALRGRLLDVSGAGLEQILVIAPGVEVINLGGDLTIGLANQTGSENIEALSDADWDLSGWRYGSRQAPGVLTLRASEDLVFNNSLSDGFIPIEKGSDLTFAESGNSRLWLAPLQSVSDKLPLNTQSWSYRLAAGADLGASDFQRSLGVDALDSLRPGKGSVLVGEFFATAVPNSVTTGTGAGVGRDGQTADTIRINAASNNKDRGTRYEVVRTGTGGIEIAAARDLQLRNPFATVYTAGVAVADPSRVFSPGDFLVPVTTPRSHPDQGGTLGAAQQNYGAYFGLAGGDLRISAGQDIGRFSRLADGTVVSDASMQLPAQWLYRRGLVDPATGLFSSVVSSGVRDHSASTTWWIDYSNFFQGFGALGGGNIRMAAARDLVNADAAIPTSARMAGQDPLSGDAPDERRNLAPDTANLLEYGGGDLLVQAGRNLDGGNFYVERGRAKLRAADDITTNEARSLTPWRLTPSQNLLDASTWQAVTLYGGRTQFDVAARGDVLLGPATAAFLLPQGLNNKFWYKTQFQSIGPSAGLSAASFGGAVTHRMGVTLPGDTLALPVLEAAYRQGSAISPGSAAYYRPWLRSAESDTSGFRTVASVALPSLRSTAFGGDVTVVGQLNLFPSPEGELELLASGAIPGLAVSGLTRAPLGESTLDVTAWTSARLNLSDADGSRVPSSSAPLGIQQVAGSGDFLTIRDTSANPWASVATMFNETGAYKGVYGTTEVKSALHAAAPVHVGNPNPVRLYAAGGDLANITLFAPKKIRAVAARDIADIAFYLQHVSPEDVSLVSAGRDIIPYNENAALRVLAENPSAGNLIVDEARDTVVPAGPNKFVQTKALAGDIQAGGRGIVQVLAGRDIDLGSGANFADQTGVGVTSIGRLRNPALPFEGAHYVVMAGVGGVSSGPALGLGSSVLKPGALPFGGFFETGFVGVYDEKGSPKESLFISSVEDGRPAELLGLQPYDRILSASGEEIDDLDSLKRILSSASSDDISLDVQGTTSIRLSGFVEDLKGANLTTLAPTAISGRDAKQSVIVVKSVAKGSRAEHMGVRAGDFVEPRPAEGLMVIHREGTTRSVVLTADHRASGSMMELFHQLKQVGKDAALTGNYDAGYAAVESIFGKSPSPGTIFTRARDLRTTSGGLIIAAAPGGGITMASDIFGNPLTPPGIVTEYGGEVSLLTGGNIDIGRARIFTLRGGDLTIWSSRGDIAAGTAAKTVVTAPPTRVLIDAISAEIETDLGGLATGGGIGVLASVAGVEPGAVTLLAPRGTVDAGDAGIRATGNITIAAAQVRNADNIAAGGASVGVPAAPAAAAPNVGGLSSASSSSAATSQAASDVTRQAQSGPAAEQQMVPSNITVEVLGYGGGGTEEEERQEANGAAPAEEQVL